MNDAPRFRLTPDLADTICRIHGNGAFEINCSSWAKLYRQARIVVAKQKVKYAEALLKEEEENNDGE